jgi:hypothetical protein
MTQTLSKGQALKPTKLHNLQKATVTFSSSLLPPVTATAACSYQTEIQRLKIVIDPDFKMVYDWEKKEEICYRMYIEEKKSLEEIMEYLKEEHNFAPR